MSIVPVKDRWWNPKHPLHKVNIHPLGYDAVRGGLTWEVEVILKDKSGLVGYVAARYVLLQTDLDRYILKEMSHSKDLWKSYIPEKPYTLILVADREDVVQLEPAAPNNLFPREFIGCVIRAVHAIVIKPRLEGQPDCNPRVDIAATNGEWDLL